MFCLIVSMHSSKLCVLIQGLTLGAGECPYTDTDLLTVFRRQRKMKEGTHLCSPMSAFLTFQFSNTPNMQFTMANKPYDAEAIRLVNKPCDAESKPLCSSSILCCMAILRQATSALNDAHKAKSVLDDVQ